MRLNVQTLDRRRLTHEGAPARRIIPEQELRRSVMACMLWEDTFYESGVDIATRITDLVGRVSPRFVADLAVEARGRFKLRHVPLLLVRELARKPRAVAPFVQDILYDTIQRPDELAEFMAIYWKDGRCPISAQVKKGLARAFGKFDEYQLAKYNRDGAIKLRDVLFLCHAKPGGDREELYRRLVANELAVPDTWEVALSSGADKKATWERLISEGKLGALALLRNLRNMKTTGVADSVISDALDNAKLDRVLPFRFIAAARYNPSLEPALEKAMFRCLEGMAKLPGGTILLVDVSGSMNDRLTVKSEMTRMDAASGLAVLARELCETVRILTFSHQLVEVPPRRGFSLRDAIDHSQAHGGTYLGAAVERVHRDFSNYDRIIVFTDEQSHDTVPNPKIGKGYMVNVACYKNGVGYGPWMHIDGFSEAILDYIKEVETEER